MTDLFGETAALYGFDYFICGFVASTGSPAQPRILFGRPHLPSAQGYAAENLAPHDPTIQYLFSSTTSFTWEDVKQRPMTPQQRRVFSHAEEHGFVDGLVVPVHGAHGDIWGVMLPCQARMRLDAQARTEISAAAILYATMGAALAELQQEPSPSPLTRRETQCLAWASRGKSDWEIAQILAIGDKTVNMHIDSARKKLGVTSRAQAALEAWKRGWLVDHPN